jgi:hypothetical protein
MVDKKGRTTLGFTGGVSSVDKGHRVEACLSTTRRGSVSEKKQEKKKRKPVGL